MSKGVVPQVAVQRRSPRVTVGLPVYNGERFVDQAITSIRRQTFVDFELIIADNASTDGTLDICERHAAEDDRIRILSSSRNLGAAWNFNRIVPVAAAELFKWAAHDDLLEPEFLERCVAVLDASPTTVLCYPRAVDIDVEGQVIAPIDSVKYAEDSDPVVRVRESLSFNSSCVETFGVMRTSTLRSTGMIGAYTSSDRVLLLQLAAQGPFHEVDDWLMKRRQHEDRSVRVNARERDAWFDPARADLFTFPQWRVFAEFAHTVGAAPASKRARARMSIYVLRWGASRYRKLGRELAASLVEGTRRVVSGIGGRLAAARRHGVIDRDS